MLIIYSHDNLKDSLTNLAAPALFYEELRRGVSRMDRSGDQLSLIRLVLCFDKDSGITEGSATETNNDEEILAFAEILLRSTRSEDLCARMGKLEFVILLYAPESVAESYIKRISIQWPDLISTGKSHSDQTFLKVLFFLISSQPGQSSLELLNRLDREPLYSLS